MVPDDELEHFIYVCDFHNICSIEDITKAEPLLRLTARHFGVSIYALGWRLVEHKAIKKDIKEIVEMYLNSLHPYSA